MKKKLSVLFLGCGVVLLTCFGCGCGGYLLAPPTDIVGVYDDEPVTVAGSWEWQWDFKDSGVGTAKQKMPGEMAGEIRFVTVRFDYQYTRRFPEVKFGMAGPDGIAAHSLELSNFTVEGGAMPEKLKTEPGKSRRFAVFEAHGLTIFENEDPAIPAWVLQRR